MPRIDPVKLLSCLKVLLAPNGGIRSANEVKRIAELMLKYSKKLVSKCIYIQILKCTNTDLLEKFMGAGGWGLTHIWLSDGIRTMNWPLVQEILELLLLCPVDVQRLRSNTAPKLVKSLCKDGGNEGVRILATKLVEQWLKIVKGETMATTRNIQNASGAPSLPTDMSDHPSGVSQANAVNTIVIENHSTSHASEATKEQDPLAITPHNTDEAVVRKASSINLQSPNAGDSALVYKIVIKDGKQVLAKVDPPTTGGDVGKDKSESESKRSESKKGESPQPDSPGAKDKEKDDDSKDSKESDKEKRDKEKSRDKDHKSSSSSHRRSSSSSSSKLSSSKSSSGSGSSSSKSKHHSSSSSSRRSSKDGSNSSSSSKSKDRDKERDKDRDRSYDKDRDKDKKSSKSSSSNSSSSSSKSKDRDRDKDKEKHRSSKDKDRDHKDKDNERSKEDKHKDKYKSDSQSSDSSERSSKKSKEDSGSSPSHKPQLTSIQIPSKKASMSIEVRRDIENRPKTVKTYNSQFRSHGLAEEAPPPPSRKGLKKPITQSTPGTTIMSNIQLKRPSPPPEPSSPTAATTPSTAPAAAEKESPVPEKKIKIDLTPPAERAEKPGGIKLIAAKPKPSFLVESDMFMDALSASAHLKKDVRKRKRRPSTSKDADKESSTPGSPPESPVSQKVAPLKFYQDTLEEKEDGSGGHIAEEKSVIDLDDDKNEDEDDIPLKRVKEVIEEKRVEEERLRRENEVIDESELNAKKPPGPGCGPDGPPGVLMLHRRRGPKKKLKWRPQEELEEVRFFELDETERVNVTKTFTDMKQIERFSEREAFMMARKLNCEDIMVEQTPYMPLIEVDDVPPHPEGNQSKEKKIQSEREQTTLKALYFSRAMIPESPAEPDMEEYHITEPAVIPLDDITGNPDAVNDFTSIPWPDPKGSPPPSDFINNSDNVFQQPTQFPPFMPFKPNWNVEHGNGPPNGMPPSLLGPLNNFNNMNMNNMNNLHNIHNMNNMVPPNMPPSLLMPPNTPDDRGNMNMNMNMMGNNFGGPNPFGPGPGNNGPGFDNMMGGFGLNNMGMNPNNNNNNSGNNNRGGGGNWRGGGGGNWRPQGGNVSRTWLQGNSSRVCKQFQRGYCRNGIKCSYLHITPNRL